MTIVLNFKTHLRSHLNNNNITSHDSHRKSFACNPNLATSLPKGTILTLRDKPNLKQAYLFTDVTAH